MAILKTLLLVAQILSALGVIGLVLLQHGKGADMGAAFGSGASGSLFGATGSANFLSRSTAVLAFVFFATCLGLAMFSRTGHAGLGVMSSHENAAPVAEPVVTASASAPAPAVSPFAPTRSVTVAPVRETDSELLTRLLAVNRLPSNQLRVPAGTTLVVPGS